MGAVMTAVKIWNATDLGLARLGAIAPEAVRQTTIEALVDTGAVTMVIPEDVARLLDLPVLELRTVTLADGTQRQVPKVGELRIEILGRQMTCDAFVTPSGTTPLIGQIPLEDLDLIVDPGTREIRVRSEEGPRALLLHVAA
jgi:clan AA aspartic protease